MTLQITPLYAALLALMAIALAGMVSALRGRTGISIFHGDDVKLGLAIRRHGNFIEYVPLALILMGMAELKGAGAVWLHAMGTALIVSRLMHAIGLKAEDARNIWRIAGGAGTQATMIGASAFLLWPAA